MATMQQFGVGAYLDMNEYTIDSDLLTANSTASPTRTEGVSSDGLHYVHDGYDFTVANGMLTGGTVTGMRAYMADGSFDLRMDGINWPYSLMIAQINSGGTIAWQQSIFSGNDSFIGTTNDDVFVSTPGNDTIDGGAGADKVEYAQSRSGFTVAKTSTGVTVADSTGALGIDTTSHIERLVFSDGTYAFDASGNSVPSWQWFIADDNVMADYSADPAAVSGNIVSTSSASTEATIANGTRIVYEGSDLSVAGGQLAGGTVTGLTLYRPDGRLDMSITGVSWQASELVAKMNSSNPYEWQTSMFSGNDLFAGGAGEDTFTSTAGDDTIEGAAGIDTVEYAQSRSTFTVTTTSTGLTVADTTAAQGSDALTGIERLEFSDGNLAFDLSGDAGQSYRIYQAAFNRTPDLAGLGYWIAQMDSGMDVVEVAARFIDSAEFRSLYGTNPTTSQTVTAIYNNVLHRDPDQAGHDFYVNQIDSHQKTLSKVLADFSESPENQAQVVGVIENGILYTPWLA